MKFLIAAVFALSGAVAHAQLAATDVERTLSPETRKALNSFALGASQGDYQAMRNYAYTWSTDAARQNPKAAIVGCAWYAQIMQMHKGKVHAGDESNRDLYCSRLQRDDLQAALSMSSRIGSKVSSANSKPIAY